jgi:hypothetical protein
VRALLAGLASLVATVALLLATAAPALADDEPRHYVQVRTGEQVEVTCSGTTCTFDAPVDPALRAFRGAITVVNGSASLTAPRKCDEVGESHGDLTLLVSLTDELLSVTWRQAKGEAWNGTLHCYYNASETVYTAQRLAVELDGAGDQGSSGPTPDPVPPSSSSSTSSTSTSVSRLESGEPDAPSVLSALPTPADVEGGQALTGILLAIVLVLLVAFPTTLLNSAAEQGSDRFSTWWRGRRGLIAPGDRPDRRWWLAGGGVFVAGVISCFVDPGFGLNAGSVRALLSVLASFTIDVVIGWAVTIWAVRRFAPSAQTSYTFKPATLVIVVVAVAFTRISGFEPGIIFGLVAGVGFGTLVGRTQEARAALVTLGYGAVAGLVAWFAYGAWGDPEGVLGTFVSETLAATAIAGLAALPIALFPLPGMPGHTVFAWSRVRWAVSYLLGLIAFFLVLMPTPYAWDEVGWSLRAWVLAYLGYLGAAVVLWSLVRRGSGAGPLDAGEDHLSRSGQA